MSDTLKEMYNSVERTIRSTLGYGRNSFNDAVSGISTTSVRPPSSCCSKSKMADLWGYSAGASCRNWVRVGGLSASAAIALTAYGSHVITAEEWRMNDNRKRAFDNASKHHLLHSLGVILAHKSHYPFITAALLTSGMVLFCGPCYAYGIWNEERFRRFVPIGGFLFILGWLSFVL